MRNGRKILNSLYFEQGMIKIESKEMTTNVKEAKKEAFKTVERHVAKKINGLIIF
ncbi:hypothetical protein [Niallia sp. Krafla_26]|uniref:hypothetical protein n=1 Tax=Niallia sp. Krafla_26 TaxID=3064703 RepID=UPI003D1807A9